MGHKLYLLFWEILLTSAMPAVFLAVQAKHSAESNGGGCLLLQDLVVQGSTRALVHMRSGPRSGNQNFRERGPEAEINKIPRGSCAPEGWSLPRTKYQAQSCQSPHCPLWHLHEVGPCPLWWAQNWHRDRPRAVCTSGYRFGKSPMDSPAGNWLMY